VAGLSKKFNDNQQCSVSVCGFDENTMGT